MSMQPAKRVSDAFARFLATENAGAKLLGIATIVALVWASSPVGDWYDSLWHVKLPEAFSLGGRIPDLRHAVNDLFMAVFFFVVGLEIRRELAVGELNSRENATMPIIAAIGGMVAPALVYTALNAGTGSSSGWGIPIATDIAFAVALIDAVKGLPHGLKVFLLSLAIVDDILAIAVIAIFYADEVSVTWLIALGAMTLAVLALHRKRDPAPLVLLGWGVLLWMAAVFAGIHPTIAGVLLAFALPVTSEDNEPGSIEARLHPWSSYLIVPLFALANAGVAIDLPALEEAITSSLGLGIIIGLIGGKIVGITLFSVLAEKLGIARRPDGVGWTHLLGTAAAAGIGFTVSIFIAGLAFNDDRMVEVAKLAILVASLGAALVATLVFRAARSSS